MKKFIFLTFAGIVSFLNAFSQTSVSGTLSGNTIWTKAASPYQINGNVTLNSGDTLIVEPGAEVQFMHYSRDLIINGTMLCEGLSNDSILIRGNPNGGEVILNGQGSRFSFTYFSGLGAFNNPALKVLGQNIEVKRSTFNYVEVGVYVGNGANPLIDSSEFIDNRDYAIQVYNGSPVISNNLIDNAIIGAIYLLDTAFITDNTIQNISYGGNSMGIHIDDNFYPYISDNTFINNSIDILTHPAVVNDTVFDNNGFSRIHLDNKVIGESTVWHKPQLPESWDYAFTGDITVNAGDTLKLQPGVRLTFLNYTYDLIINGRLESIGISSDSIFYYGNPLGGRVILNGSSEAVFERTSVYGLGAFNNPALAVHSSDVLINRNTFDNCEVAATVYSGATPEIDSNVVLYGRDYAVKVENGYPRITNNLFDQCNAAGVYLLDSAYITNNTITNTALTSYSAGIYIYNDIYPYIDNNTFSGNNYADIITHPAVVDDTVFDNNGISVIHIRNTVIGRNSVWHEPVLPEDWYYILMGDITVNTGDTLWIQPGVDAQFDHYTTDLMINGALISNGTNSDSIIFRGTPLGGRVMINSSGSGSLKYTKVSGLGAFNNPALAAYSSDLNVSRSTFTECEVGITVYSGAEPIIDSSSFISCADYGMNVLSGNPLITNSVFDDNRLGGIRLEDTARIIGNQIINNGFQFGYAGIWIDQMVFPFIDDNVFMNNAWDVLTHPNVVDDTTFDNNGLTRIHIDNKSLVTSTTWHAPQGGEDWEYVSSGDVTVNSGDTLTIEGGAKYRFRSYTHDLFINGSLKSLGTENDSVIFYSDAQGGRVILGSSSANNQISFTEFNNLAVGNNPGLSVSSDLNLYRSAFDHCEVGLYLGGSANVLADSCRIENCIDYGIRVASGSLDIGNSCIFDNTYGVLADTLSSVVAQENWWGDATGPSHSTNLAGLGDVVSNHVNFSNWLNYSPCLEDPGPQILNLDPLHLSTNVPVGARLKVQFNEDIQKTSGGLVSIIRQSDQFVLFQQDITNASILVNADSLTFTPGLLPVSTSMYVTIDSNAVQNLNNAAFKGISTDTVWLFTTEPDDDNDGFTPSQGDCDDNDSLEFPGQKWFADIDMDTFGDVNNFLIQCERPAGYILDSLDCDDNDALEFPGQIWYRDSDNDGWGDVNNTLIQCLRPAGYVLDTADCDDMDPDEFPGQKWFADTDSDGYGDVNNFLIQCEQPTGYLLDSLDCDDNDSLQFPGQKWFADTDGDLFGDVSNFLIQCLKPAGYVLDSTDCDDTDPLEFPGQVWYTDLDMDGFGDVNNTLTQCERPPGYLRDSTDCDDLDSLEFPGQKWFADTDGDLFGDVNNFLIQCEQPMGYLLDSLDCDDNDPDEFPGQVWYADMDGDQFGDSLNSMIQCERPVGFVLDNTDCDDTDSTSYPGASELLDNKDNDCDGEVDEDFIGIEDFTKNNDLFIYPNPTSGKFRLDWNSSRGAIVEINVLTTQGVFVKNLKVNQSLRESSLEGLSNGIYLLNIEFERGEVIKKISLIH